MDITIFLKAVITLIFAILVTFLVPWIKANINEKTLKNVVYWTSVAVDWAEQIFKESGMGAKKKEEVLKFLESKGFTVDFDDLDHLIEAFVKRMNDDKEKGAE